LPKLKDYIALDMKTFFNADEFSEEHKINSKNLVITIDNDRLKERQGKEFNGTYIGELLYFAKVSDFEEMPSVGDDQKFDSSMMYVSDIKEDNGMYEIILSQNRGN
jgi:hypothetical protein